MHRSWLLVWSLTFAAACAAEDYVDDPEEDVWLDGKGDGASAVNVKTTNLTVDLASKTAVASIALEKNGNVALEVGGLRVSRVTDDRGRRRHKVLEGKLLVSNVRGELFVEYAFDQRTMADGLLPGSSTVMWPYYCGNIYPCHSQPADGTTFTLELDGVPSGKTAVYPKAIEAEAPPYMLAWAVGAYTKKALGTTTAGTRAHHAAQCRSHPHHCDEVRLLSITCPRRNQP